MKFYTLFLLTVSTCLSADQWDGSAYEKNSSVQKTHAEWLIKSTDINETDSILDIGCGNGKTTSYLASKVPLGSVIGIDPSPSMLEKTARYETNNLHFQQGSAETFSLTKKFDHVFSIQTMHWVREQQKALSNIYNHLKPCGKLHFVIAQSKDDLPFAIARDKTVKKWENSFTTFVNPQQFFDTETYRKLIVNSGFRVDSIHYLYHESIHENKEKLRLWIKQWYPYTMHLKEEEKDPFMHDLVDAYLETVGIGKETEESVVWGEYVLIVNASKLP